MKENRRSGTISINGQILRVDESIAMAVIILNSRGIITLGCCSGHYRYRPTIIIEEINGTIRELISGREIPRKKRFYIRDKKGFYYIPEVDDEK